MIIRFLTQDSKVTPEDIDQQIRRLPGMFSAPSDLVAYARRQGLRAEEYNRGSLQQVEDLVARGIPLMPLLDLTPDNALDFDHWHWVVVVGVESTGDQKVLTINNPWGQQEEWWQGKFLKEWARLRLLGLAFGYSNYFIAVGTLDDELPPRSAKGVASANAITKGLADLLNGFVAVRWGRILGGIGQMLRGASKLAYGIVCILILNIRYQVKPASKS